MWQTTIPIHPLNRYNAKIQVHLIHRVHCTNTMTKPVTFHIKNAHNIQVQTRAETEREKNKKGQKIKCQQMGGRCEIAKKPKTRR